MTTSLVAPPARSVGLTTARLETVRSVRDIAGLPPVSGYATGVLAVAVATDAMLSAALSAIDLDDADEITDAAEVLLRWHRRAFRVTA